MSLTGWLLAAAGAALAAGTAGLAGADPAGAPAWILVWLAVAVGAYGLAVAVVLRRPPGPRGTAVILLLGVGLRLALVPIPPVLSTDVYRYVWDGRVGAQGTSPYAHAPAAPELARLRDVEVFPRINRPDWPTIYPPGAQLLFSTIARLTPRGGDGVAPVKAVLVLADLLALGLVVAWLRERGQPAAWSLIHAWHPLLVLEVAASGHLDGAVLPACVGALWAASRGRDGWAGALVGMGTLLKLYPVLLLAAVVGRRPGRTLVAWGAVVAGGYALYLVDGPRVLGSLLRFVGEESWNSLLPGLLAALLGTLSPAAGAAGRWLPLAAWALAALAVVAWGRGRAPALRARGLVGGYLLAVPVLYPWYALWLVPVLAVAPSTPWLLLTLGVGLGYVALVQPVWHLPAWVPVAQLIPVLAGLALLALRPPDRSPQPC